MRNTERTQLFHPSLSPWHFGVVVAHLTGNQKVWVLVQAIVTYFSKGDVGMMKGMGVLPIWLLLLKLCSS